MSWTEKICEFLGIDFWEEDDDWDGWYEDWGEEDDDDDDFKFTGTRPTLKSPFTDFTKTFNIFH